MWEHTLTSFREKDGLLFLDFSSSLRHKCKFKKMQNSLVEQASTAFSSLSICPGNKAQFHKDK